MKKLAEFASNEKVWHWLIVLLAFAILALSLLHKNGLLVKPWATGFSALIIIGFLALYCIFCVKIESPIKTR